MPGIVPLALHKIVEKAACARASTSAGRPRRSSSERLIELRLDLMMRERAHPPAD